MSTLHHMLHCYRFADLRLDTGQRQVWRHDAPVPLSKLSFDMLLTLVENAPNVVTHDDLATLVWGDTRVITSENITQRVMVLRRSLGDSSASPRYIKGVRGYGYRLIPEVTVIYRPRADGARRARLLVPPRTPRTRWISVAVLPFVQATADPREVELARSLREEVTQCLGRLTTVKVVASASSEPDPNEPRSMTQIAASHVVDLIAKGHVGVWGRHVHADVQLVDPLTCALVWSRSYDGDITAALSLQTDVARDLVEALYERYEADTDPNRFEAREFADAL